MKKTKNKLATSKDISLYLTGLLVGVGVTLLSAVICGIVITLVDSSQFVVDIMAVVALSFGAFVGSYVMGYKTKKNGLILGLINGLLIFLVLSVVGIILEGFMFEILDLIKLIFSLILGGVGGILAVNRSARRSI